MCMTPKLAGDCSHWPKWAGHRGAPNFGGRTSPCSATRRWACDDCRRGPPLSGRSRAPGRPAAGARVAEPRISYLVPRPDAVVLVFRRLRRSASGARRRPIGSGGGARHGPGSNDRGTAGRLPNEGKREHGARPTHPDRDHASARVKTSTHVKGAKNQRRQPPDGTCNAAAANRRRRRHVPPRAGTGCWPAFSGTDWKHPPRHKAP